MVSKNAWLALALALILGGILRFYQLVNFPPSLNWDEVSHAYNAWSLVQTGHDQWGKILPVLNFRAYGDYPTTMSLYGTVTAIAVLGRNDFAVRFPGAMLGTLSVILAFGAGYYWRRNKYQGMLLGFLTALEPWSFFTSRQVLQSNWTVFLIFSFLMFFLRRNRLAALVILGLTVFSYHNARIYVPAAAGLLFWVWKDRLSRLIAGGIVALSILILLSPAARARSSTVGIVDSGAIASIEAMRNNSVLPPSVKRWLYNRPVYLIQKVAVNYIDYFSPQYLFQHGGTQYQFSLPRFGLLTFIDLPFFYLGLLLVFVESPIAAILLFLSPLPAAITQDRFAVVRSTIMLPFVLFIITLGFSKFKFTKLIWLYVFLAGILLLPYYNNYFAVYPKQYSQSWQYGYQQVIAYLNTHQDQYDQIIFTKEYGEPHEYVLWYSNNDLNVNPTEWDYHDNWYWVQRLGKVHFVNDWELNSYVNQLPKGGKYLIISSPDNQSKGNLLSTINFLDGKPAFFIKDL